MNKTLLSVFGALFLALVAVSATNALPAFADSTIAVQKETLDIDFPNQMTFRLAASSAAEITKAELVVRFSGVTQRIKPEFTPAKDLDTVAVWNLSAQNVTNAGGYMPPGVSGTYTWQLEDAAGNKTETEPKSFYVEDTRYPFRVGEDDVLAVHWYGIPQADGEYIYSNADKFVQQLRQELGISGANKIEVWIYPNLEDFRSAMPDARDWTGGRSFFNYHVTLLSGLPKDRDYTLAAVRHETTHQTLSDYFGGGIGEQSLPLWMNEGFAVYNELERGGLTGDYAEVLERRMETNDLPSLRSLASNFATDRDDALVSYSISASVVKMMIDKYGWDKFRDILAEFKKGLTTDQALKNVYGADTTGLENMWRKSVGLPERDPSQVGFFTPEAQPTFAISAPETPAPKSNATATPRSVAAQNTPAPAAAATVPQNSNSTEQSAPSTGLCGGVLGGMALAMVGAYGWRKRRRPTRL